MRLANYRLYSMDGRSMIGISRAGNTGGVYGSSLVGYSRHQRLHRRLLLLLVGIRGVIRAGEKWKETALGGMLGSSMIRSSMVG